MPHKASDWVLAQPWAITEEYLGVILDVAERRNDSVEAVEARLGRPLDNTHETTIRDGVAIIPVVGPISRYADLFSQISGATAIDTLAKDFRTALDDRSVRAVILNMDTPGGTVSGVSEFARHVAEARGQGKPVVAYVGSQAASAGYWIASAADRVVVDPTATVGSIGVVMGLRKPADPKAGMARTVEFVSSQSPRKRPDPDTEAGRAQVQATADDLADVFVDAVALHRGVSREAVLSDFGQGGVLVGAKAVEAGMADGVGSLEHTIACLARGEMPCPPAKKKPVKYQSRPKEPAMSEPTTPPVAGDQDNKANAEIDRLKAELLAERGAKASAIEEAISARADAFVGEVVGAANKTMYALALREGFVLAARDDQATPLASKTQRQDALKEILKHKGAPTKEMVNADPTSRSHALGMDPADDDPAPGSASDKDLDDLYDSTAAWASGRKGKK